MQHTHLLSIIAATALLGACGDGKSKPSKIAAAFEHQVDPKGDAKQAGEQMQKLKEKVAADAEAAVLAQIDKVTVPAAHVPSESKAAGDESGRAFDEFVQKRLASNKDELEKWKVMKGYDLDKAVEACLTENQPKVAACQKNAFANASLEIGRDRAESLLATCTKKFGMPLAAAPGGPGDKARPQG